MSQQTVAIIGSGIAGLSAAWLLARHARATVTVFEREGHVGGHSNTVDVGVGTRPIPIDTGFIVYNTACYPNLVALFDLLAVPTAETSMSFAVSLGDGDYEYSGSGAFGLFGQVSNLLNPNHWRMTSQILRFFREAGSEVRRSDRGLLEGPSLGDWLSVRGYSRPFIERHIMPMAAAIWSAKGGDILSFPALAFFRFFANHGLLQVANRPAWRTVRGGSREYVRRLVDDARLDVRTGCAAVSVRRRQDGAIVTLADGRTFEADHVILATHANESLALLGDADDVERGLLSPFRYATNHAVLHIDRNLMPKRGRLWSSWNVIGHSRDRAVCVTYWMNRLQPLATTEDHFVTLNPLRDIAERDVLARFDYTHPIFDGPAMAAQRRLWSLQGRRRTWFAGSYFGFGFHEDGIQSGLAVAEALGGARRPWLVPADAWSRIHVGAGPTSVAASVGAA